MVAADGVKWSRQGRGMVAARLAGGSAFSKNQLVFKHFEVAARSRRMGSRSRRMGQGRGMVAADGVKVAAWSRRMGSRPHDSA